MELDLDKMSAVRVLGRGAMGTVFLVTDRSAHRCSHSRWWRSTPLRPSPTPTAVPAGSSPSSPDSAPTPSSPPCWAPWRPRTCWPGPSPSAPAATSTPSATPSPTASSSPQPSGFTSPRSSLPSPTSTPSASSTATSSPRMSSSRPPATSPSPTSTSPTTSPPNPSPPPPPLIPLTSIPSPFLRRPVPDLDPKLHLAPGVLHTVFLLGFVRRLISWVFTAVSLGDLLNSDIPEEMQDSFSNRLWAAAGVPDSFYDYSYSPFPSPPSTPTRLLHHQLLSS